MFKTDLTRLLHQSNNADVGEEGKTVTISGSRKGAVICSEVNASILTSSFANFMSIRIICKSPVG